LNNLLRKLLNRLRQIFKEYRCTRPRSLSTDSCVRITVERLPCQPLVTRGSVAAQFEKQVAAENEIRPGSGLVGIAHGGTHAVAVAICFAAFFWENVLGKQLLVTWRDEINELGFRYRRRSFRVTVGRAGNGHQRGRNL